MSHRALLAAAGAQGKNYIEDLFSAYPYAGNGGTQSITNGVDLADNGGMVWVKGRTSAGYSNYLTDTVRGGGKPLITDATNSELVASAVTAFSNSGFSAGNYVGANASGQNYASWTFRRAPKFFDVVTWTGDGTSNRQIPHALGIAPGMVTAKRRDAAGDWAVWHRSATGDLYLDLQNGQTGSFTQITATSATTFSVSGNANINGATYVAYLWAHDPDTVNGIVQCGSFTTDASGNATVNLGWEPQFLVLKQSSAVSDWWAMDSARSLGADSSTRLSPNNSTAESAPASIFRVTATGFAVAQTASTNYIYLAIRRGPMRTPTSGASVYNAIARTGTGAAATVTGVGFAPDLVMNKSRSSGTSTYLVDRLVGRAFCSYIASVAPGNPSPSANDITSFDMSGVSMGAPNASNFNASGTSEIDWFFRRAPGFFDLVCWVGNGAATQTLSHGLAVAPELMLMHWRSGGSLTTNSWRTYSAQLGTLSVLDMQTSGASSGSGAGQDWNGVAPTTTSFLAAGSGNGSAQMNNSGATYTAYLFASCPGVSKVGTYTGTGAVQDINCGFTNGARFVLIKKTSAAGNWMVFDTTRGIVAGNDPYLMLNMTSAEDATADVIDPYAAGFELPSGDLIGINTAGATYIFLAIA